MTSTKRGWPGLTTSAADAFGLPDAAPGPRQRPRTRYDGMTHISKAGFSVLEFAYGVGLSRSKVYELMREGAIQYLKIGQRRLITETPADWLTRLQEARGPEETAMP